MATKKYLGYDGLSDLAGYIKERLKTVDAMPASAADGTVVLFKGTTGATYTNGHIYQYSTATSSWTDISPAGGSGSSTLAGLSDVTLSTPSTGDSLNYNSTSGKWINEARMKTDGSNAASEVAFNSAFTVGNRVANSTVGANSVAEGSNTIASGDYSHANGNYTTAGYDNQTVVGKYNDNKSATLFEVGNGTSGTGNESNAFEVYSDGNISTDNGATKVKTEVVKVIAPVEDGTTAVGTYAIGDQFIRGSVLYKAKTAITAGDTLTLNTNYEAIDDITTQIDTKANKVSSATNGNFAGLDSNGNLTDSGKKASDFVVPSSLDSWTSAVTASSSGTDVIVVFNNLSDAYGYKLYCEDTLVGIKAMTKETGSTIGTIKLTFVLDGATAGTTQCKLRIMK